MNPAPKSVPHFGETEFATGPEGGLDTLELLRKILCWAYVVVSLKCLAESAHNLSFVIQQFESMPILRGPIGPALVSIITCLVAGVAWWTLWRRRRSGRARAIALSLILIFSYFTQFIFSIRSGRDRHLSALLLGIVGLVVFWRRQTQADDGGITRSYRVVVPFQASHPLSGRRREFHAGEKLLCHVSGQSDVVTIESEAAFYCVDTSLFRACCQRQDEGLQAGG
jgi:hypothetical protein